MAVATHAIELDPSVFAAAQRLAEKEHKSIEALLESLVRYRAEYVGRFDQAESEEAFSLDDWEMDRGSEESDEEYEARLELFR